MSSTSLANARLVALHELSNAEARIRQQHLEIFDLKEKINNTSPIIATLTVDILVEIFRLVVNAAVDAGSRSFELPALFTVGGVCREFRKVAWGFPGLWKELRIHISEDKALNQLDLAQEWMERSRSTPLNLHLKLNQPASDDESAAVGRILCVLLLECRRWNSLSVEGAGASLLCNELAKGGYEFPQLTILSIGNEAEDPVVPPLSAQWIFDKARIHRLAIITPGWSKDHFQLDWTSISSVYLYGNQPHVSQILPLVAENICEAHICFTTDEPPPPEVEFTALHTLQIGAEGIVGDFIGDNRSLAAGLVIPCLQRLTVFAFVEVGMEYPDADLLQLSGMIIRSKCMVVDLKLFNVKSSSEDVVRMLQHIPTLERLHLRIVILQLTSLLFEAMTPSEGRTAILPRISTIIYEGLLSAGPSAITGFVKSRLAVEGATNPSLQKLQSLTIHCTNSSWAKERDPNIIFSFYHDMTSLRSQGFQFTVDYGEDPHTEG